MNNRIFEDNPMKKIRIIPVNSRQEYENLIKEIHDKKKCNLDSSEIEDNQENSKYISFVNLNSSFNKKMI